jgi:hypothetical protein
MKALLLYTYDPTEYEYSIAEKGLCYPVFPHDQESMKDTLKESSLIEYI